MLAGCLLADYRLAGCLLLSAGLALRLVVVVFVGRELAGLSGLIGLELELELEPELELELG